MVAANGVQKQPNVKTAEIGIYDQLGARHTNAMPPRRIHITGASGAGTTTLGAVLSRKLGWRHLDADHYYWLPRMPPFQQKRERALRLQMILEDLNTTEHVVVSGSVVRWGGRVGGCV